MEWDVSEITSVNSCRKYAIVLLNHSLEKVNLSYIVHLWKKAEFRVCVDGGINLFHSLLYQNGRDSSTSGINSSNSRINSSTSAIDSSTSGVNSSTSGVNSGISRINSTTLGINSKTSDSKFCISGTYLTDTSSVPLPDFISGDLDSAKVEILEFYERKGVRIVPTPDQDETDFYKALLEMGCCLEKTGFKVEHILVVAGINSLRFDHILSHLHVIHKVRPLLSVPIVMMSEPSLMWLLDPGSHTILVPSCITGDAEKNWCSVCPLAGSALVSTTGLKWNLDNQEMSMGKLISTSNTYDTTANGVVCVSCSRPVLWSMGFSTEAPS